MVTDAAAKRSLTSTLLMIRRGRWRRSAQPGRGETHRGEHREVAGPVEAMM